ncbi:MAG: Neutral/alkaline non-lysosomal ceramidase, partial [Streptosporangiaceae bacterium]|nr:Neutral/alkaline non-lysosomal ceramidase [Streptosporangiaceae bacterium]
AFLAGAIPDLVTQAAERLEPATLSWEIGRADFAVNRRNNKEADVPTLRTQGALQGPVDHDVPVLRVDGADGNARAVLFGYACHCTVLGLYQFCGDYAGFAQIAIEKANPGAQAMFVAGCGGDQNPVPRKTVELAEQYGRQLAASVGRVLGGPLRPIKADAPLVSADDEIDLPFSPPPTREQIEADAKSSNFSIANRARHLLNILDTQGSLPSEYPYPVEVWRLGDLTWIFLGGEVVVDYSLRLKRNLGSSHTWVSAYCNDVMAYIPSLRVLREGGYEGATSMVPYVHASAWGEAIEEDINAAVIRLLRRLPGAPE